MPQVGAFGVTLLGYVAVALVAASQALMALTTRDDYATPALQCAAWLALAAAAVLVIATLVTTVPVDERDGALVFVAIALGVAGLAGAGGAVAVAAGPSSCERFTFDRSAWSVTARRRRTRSCAVAPSSVSTSARCSACSVAGSGAPNGTRGTWTTASSAPGSASQSGTAATGGCAPPASTRIHL